MARLQASCRPDRAGSRTAASRGEYAGRSRGKVHLRRSRACGRISAKPSA